jgi:hypothetical protein
VIEVCVKKMRIKQIEIDMSQMKDRLDRLEGRKKTPMCEKSVDAFMERVEEESASRLGD